jgi:hypothetical protein
MQRENQNTKHTTSSLQPPRADKAEKLAWITALLLADSSAQRPSHIDVAAAQQYAAASQRGQRSAVSQAGLSVHDESEAAGSQPLAACELGDSCCAVILWIRRASHVPASRRLGPCETVREVGVLADARRPV